jgi:imidazolonepropionase-like amidohydrolase
MKMLGFGWTALALAACMADAAWGQAIDAVKGARIITVSGETIDGGTLLIKEGRIAAVGKDVEIPADARVLDAAGKVLAPGWIEPHTSRGLDRANERVGSVPFVSVADSINPVDPFFEDSVRKGVTAILAMPGPEGMIGGRGVIVRPSGVTIEEMVMARDAAMKLSLAPGQGRSKMAHVAALRKEFDDIKDYLASLKEKKELPASATPAKVRELDAKRKPMADLIEGKLPVVIYCPDDGDIVRAQELAATYGLKALYVVGPTAWRAASFVKRHDLPVVLDSNLVYWETDEKTLQQVRRVVPKFFHDAGVTFALQTGVGGAVSEMWFQVATCVKYGIPREAALRAATLVPARWIGLGDRLGSIEKGKDATFQILSGDPLDVSTWVEKVVIEGRVVYEREKDRKLRRLLGAPE